MPSICAFCVAPRRAIRWDFRKFRRVPTGTQKWKQRSMKGHKKDWSGRLKNTKRSAPGKFCVSCRHSTNVLRSPTGIDTVLRHPEDDLILRTGE